jgi:hypothetical protein
MGKTAPSPATLFIQCGKLIDSSQLNGFGGFWARETSIGISATDKRTGIGKKSERDRKAVVLLVPDTSTFREFPKRRNERQQRLSALNGARRPGFKATIDPAFAADGADDGR